MSIERLIDYFLFGSCLFILGGSIYLTCKTRFVQMRFFSILIKMLKGSFTRQKQESKYTIQPHKALFTAMSTTLGISTIVGPVIAINLGGPGALFGFLITSFFGAAATFTEVNLSIQFRKKLANGAIMGGPMQYLKVIFSPFIAKWYAVCGLILMMAWSGAQANQLSAVLNSPLLGAYRISTFITGIVVAILALLTLLGGIRAIGSFSAKLVPFMFMLYLGSCLWIVSQNFDKFGTIFSQMFYSTVFPYQMASGALVGGIVLALRWGIFKGTHTSEAGVGTQSIPHSMAETHDPVEQGSIAMLSTFTAGFVAFLSGCVALISNTWQDPNLPLGISMVVASFQQYFSYFGMVIIAISALLFGFGTILGNSYNGLQCYSYLSNNKKTRYYLIGTTLMVFIGAISEVKLFWAYADLILAAMALPHMAALVYYAYTEKEFGMKIANVGSKYKEKNYASNSK